MVHFKILLIHTAIPLQSFMEVPKVGSSMYFGHISSFLLEKIPSQKEGNVILKELLPMNVYLFHLKGTIFILTL